MMERGDTSQDDKTSPTPPLPPVMPQEAVAEAVNPDSSKSAKDAAAAAALRAELAAKEEEDFQALKRRIDALVREAGLADKVSTTVRGAA